MTTAWELKPWAIFNQTITQVNAIADGDCEKVGVTDWSVGNSATLTKAGSHPNNGAQCLRVAYNGFSHPYAYQTPALTVGKKYRAKFRARSDGTAVPRFINGSTVVWTGTTSTDWQDYDTIYTAVNVLAAFQAYTTGASYAEFDSIEFVELTDNELEVGSYYYFYGRVRGDDYAAPEIWNGEKLLWTGSTSSSYQDAEIKFRAACTDLRLSTSEIDGESVWDDCELYQITYEEIRTKVGVANFDSHVLEIYADPDGATFEIWVDGVLQTIEGSFSKKLLTGAGELAREPSPYYQDALVDYLPGNLADVLVYEEYLDATSREQLYNFLVDKWGL